jgi:hypothetical protein
VITWLIHAIPSKRAGFGSKKRGLVMYPVTDLSEQLTLYQRVPGSSPGAPTKQINSLAMFTV